eukprot:3378170-Pleurochrysis_carterae.AAC.3
MSRIQRSFALEQRALRPYDAVPLRSRGHRCPSPEHAAAAEAAVLTPLGPPCGGRQSPRCLRRSVAARMHAAHTNPVKPQPLPPPDQSSCCSRSRLSSGLAGLQVCITQLTSHLLADLVRGSQHTCPTNSVTAFSKSCFTSSCCETNFD